MPEELHDNCGICAVSNKEGSNASNIVYSIYKMLLNMQNRGQLSAGLSTYNKDRSQILDTYKDLGLVNKVFRVQSKGKTKELMKRYDGTEGIGHVRYATSGSDDICLAQPFERHHGRVWKWFAFGFNGNLANLKELKASLLSKEGYHIVHNSDTEVMMHFISRELRFGNKPDIVEVFRNLSKKFDGAYNIAFIDASGQMVVIRDPLGIRPLSYGKNNGSVFAASETNALAACGVFDPIPIKPGEMLIMKNGQATVKRYAESPKKAHCMFEWVYFSNISSIIDGISVYSVRRNLGTLLAKREFVPIDDDTVIVPVPETSKHVCDAMAYALGTHVSDGLIRNRFVGRTFIESKARDDKVRTKFTAIKEVLNGKKVILVDDSIVRGTTSRNLIRFIKEIGGAKEVHFRVSCAPIMSPCFYGIDMSTIGELAAPKYHKGKIGEEFTIEYEKAMADDIGADSVMYQKQEDIAKAIGLLQSDLCMACLDGKYPTECGDKLFCQAAEEYKELKNNGKLKHKKNSKSKRTYE
jgi:amidophosphoribosyltransferase